MGLNNLAPDVPVQAVLKHADGSEGNPQPAPHAEPDPDRVVQGGAARMNYMKNLEGSGRIIRHA